MLPFCNYPYLFQFLPTGKKEGEEIMTQTADIEYKPRFIQLSEERFSCSDSMLLSQVQTGTD